VVTVNFQGNPELTPEEKLEAAIAAVSETDMLRGLLMKKGIKVPTGMSEEMMYGLLVKGMIPANSSAMAEVTHGTAERIIAPEVLEDILDEVDEYTDEAVEARIEKMKKWSTKALHAMCVKLGVEDHEDMTKEEMAESIALSE
jgi:hypothetical protein